MCIRDRNVILPLVGKEIPVIADPYPDPEKGTGAVKITPAHDANDFEVGQRNNLESICCINDCLLYTSWIRFELRGDCGGRGVDVVLSSPGTLVYHNENRLFLT